MQEAPVSPHDSATRGLDQVISVVPDADDGSALVPASADRILQSDERSYLQRCQRMCRSIVVLLCSLEQPCCFGVALFCLLLPLSSKRAVMSGAAGSDGMTEDHLRRGTSIGSRLVPQL